MSAEVKDQSTLSKIVNDLGKRFASRSSPAELVQKNILKEDEIQPNMSNTLVQAKASLEEEKRKDQLNRRLSNRPSKVDLKLRNILRVESNDSIAQGQDGGDQPMSPNEGISAKATSFEKRSAQLRSCLKKRPEKAQLEELNILKNTGLDPSLAAAQEKLKRAQLENALEGRLRERPPIEDLENAKIILFAETVEVLPTFRKSEYNRKPDANATFKNLTPQLKVAIREELNTFKKHEMSVHEDSLRNTCFH